jgi:hypothetical protein
MEIGILLLGIRFKIQFADALPNIPRFFPPEFVEAQAPGYGLALVSSKGKNKKKKLATANAVVVAGGMSAVGSAPTPPWLPPCLWRAWCCFFAYLPCPSLHPDTKVIYAHLPALIVSIFIEAKAHPSELFRASPNARATISLTWLELDTLAKSFTLYFYLLIFKATQFFTIANSPYLVLCPALTTTRVAIHSVPIYRLLANDNDLFSELSTSVANATWVTIISSRLLNPHPKTGPLKLS